MSVRLAVQDADFHLYVGDALETLRTLPDGSADCCVTSPPYWGLRDYGTGSWEGGDESCDHASTKIKTCYDYSLASSPIQDGQRTGTDGGAYKASCRCGAHRVDRQLGLEGTPDEYVAGMVAVFREVRRVLADTGTCWINLGDSYNAYNGNRGASASISALADVARNETPRGLTTDTLKPKDLVGIPWRVAFALQQPWLRCSFCGEERHASRWGRKAPTGGQPLGEWLCSCGCPQPAPEVTTPGWYLRSDIVWSKPNPMPESVTDRPTKAHEYVFLLSKQPRYFFDAEAVREPAEYGRKGWADASGTLRRAGGDPERSTKGDATWKGCDPSAGRNVRSVWEIATQPYPEAHFATYPEALVRRCILAGCPEWVCGTCGAPRTRLVESRSLDRNELPRDHPEWRPSRYDNGKAGDPQSPGPGQRFSDVTTLGWSDCGHNNYRAGVILDPFGGSGTTALVARNHGRKAVLIELNADYAALAAKRLQQLSLLAEPA